MKTVEYFKVDLFGNSVSVIFSNDHKHRLVLCKTWDVNKPKVMFIGLNPSTANHEHLDNTIIKVSKIAKNNGFGGFYMLNLFSYITPHPHELKGQTLRLNNKFLTTYLNSVEDVVFCWGTFKAAKPRVKKILDLVPNCIIPSCLAITNDGSPKHPLYCRDNSKFIPFV